MSTKIWFEDASHWGKEIIEAQVTPRFIWTERSKDIDVVDWMNSGFPDGWEALTVKESKARYAGTGLGVIEVPVWSYDSEHVAEFLSLLLDNPEQVVVKVESKNPNMLARAARELSELQKASPSTLIHVMGLKNRFPLMFGVGLKSVSGYLDTEFLIPPNGLPQKNLRRGDHKWCWILGLDKHEVEIPRKRIIFNARSFATAAEYWKAHDSLEFTVPPKWEGVAGIKRTKDKTVALTKTLKSGDENDKIVCNSCSVSKTCRYYRVDSICSLPRSDMVALSSFFQTRDAEQVISGLNYMMRLGSERLERGMENERTLEEIDPEVTKIYDSLFEKGVKLAKLMDPGLNKPSVGVVVNNGGQQITGAVNPKAIVAGLVRELEAHGIPRDKITPEMLSNILGHSAQPALDVVEVRGDGSGTP